MGLEIPNTANLTAAKRVESDSFPTEQTGRSQERPMETENGASMLVLADFTLGDFLVGLIAFFFLFLAIWMFIAVFADIFTRPDLSGGAKAGWVLLIFILPVIGILIYLIARPPEGEVAARGILRRE
jgi:Phospholipase_D-nuclease N-terminal